jgi:hypothetical protein
VEDVVCGQPHLLERLDLGPLPGGPEAEPKPPVAATAQQPHGREQQSEHKEGG